MKTERQIKNRLKKVEEENNKYHKDFFGSKDDNPKKTDLYLEVSGKAQREIEILKWVLEIK